MKRYIQHGDITTYDHVCRVAERSRELNEKFHFHAVENEMDRGAILHDYFLYDWHEYGDHLHGYHHPDRALHNAERDFELTPRERNIIQSHMWPLTITKIPRCREAWIVCAADKMCSIEETLDGYKKIYKKVVHRVFA